ncbi:MULTISPECIES: H-type small acid-soluble spore protein [Paenibacillus]|uniref:Small acid-soluble spore protein H n=1 Tax=Paenibacillus naphthalenovorans TaxID=162209 RepID=A0A0U2W9X2_9BACL|nr:MULTISPECIES: H-type small acid-soluble spore protein [Paenibacillus]ALS25300.1 small acid-soluble spore protein H [Paenibacillus naphthalenovorans]NTZ20208.1 H-type small acid-soluble spore protein [Paenibacillus sp. JMULE4]GCL73410.1 H-type small acid-soluble spore protein [Paenibacillus naphthalenovorans]SDI29742.1 small acid-soluble spore protein H (minor) [Paenibacillus naphthalenovorans]
MNLARAQQILNADEKIDVELNGVSVWIDSIDAEEKTAKVHAEHQPADTRVVPVEELEEVK